MTTTVDTSFLVNTLTPIVMVLITAGFGVLLTWIKRTFNIQQNSVLSTDLDKIFEEAVAIAQHEVGVVASHNLNQQTRSALIEHVLEYVEDVGPGVLDALHLDEDTLRRMAEAAVAKVAIANGITEPPPAAT